MAEENVTAEKEETKEPTPRVYPTGDGDLMIGDRRIVGRRLTGTWMAWQDVESAVRRLDPPLTTAEMAFLESLATTTAAKNGLAELKSALACGTRPKPTDA